MTDPVPDQIHTLRDARDKVRTLVDTLIVQRDDFEQSTGSLAAEAADEGRRTLSQAIEAGLRTAEELGRALDRTPEASDTKE